MAHRRSVTVTCLNAVSASSYQKECRSATARLNCFWAAGLHDTWKWTSPTEPGAPCGCACSSWHQAAAQESATNAANRGHLASFMDDLRKPGSAAGPIVDRESLERAALRG